MILTQTRALFLDAYRDLHSRKLFWVVLILNAIVIAGFGTLAVKENHFMVLGWELPFDIPLPLFVYKWIFSQVVIGQWLTWAATVLALISTASIFPDFLAGGAVELYLSKPIGRLRLFFTKYATGLMFVALQVTVFTAGSFLVLGFRGGVWEPWLFLAIPIVVLFFSYLFSIQVLLGVCTRSTLAAFFMTICAWFVIFGINQADHFLMQVDVIYQEKAQAAQKQMATFDGQIAAAQIRMDRASTRPAEANSVDIKTQLRRLTAQRSAAQHRAEQQQPPAWVKTAQPIVFGLNTLVPKTQDTIGLLNRRLFSDVVLTSVLNTTPERGPMHGWRRQIQNLLHARDTAWILCSSIAFECVMLALAAWRFCRRDY